VRPERNRLHRSRIQLFVSEVPPQYPVPGVVAMQYGPGNYLPLGSVRPPELPDCDGSHASGHVSFASLRMTREPRPPLGRELGLVEGRRRRNAHRSKRDKQAKHQTEPVPDGECSP